MRARHLDCKKDVLLVNWNGRGSEQLAGVAINTANTLRHLYGNLKETAATLMVTEGDPGSPDPEAARRRFRAVAQKLEEDARFLRDGAIEKRGPRDTDVAGERCGISPPLGRNRKAPRRRSHGADAGRCSYGQPSSVDVAA